MSPTPREKKNQFWNPNFFMEGRQKILSFWLFVANFLTSESRRKFSSHVMIMLWVLIYYRMRAIQRTLNQLRTKRLKARNSRFLKMRAKCDNKMPAFGLCSSSHAKNAFRPLWSLLFRPRLALFGTLCGTLPFWATLFWALEGTLFETLCGTLL